MGSLGGDRGPLKKGLLLVLVHAVFLSPKNRRQPGTPCTMKLLDGGNMGVLYLWKIWKFKGTVPILDLQKTLQNSSTVTNIVLIKKSVKSRLKTV